MRYAASSRAAIAAGAAVALAALLMGGCFEREARPMSGTQGTNPASQAAGGTDAAADRQVATFAAGCFWGVEAAFRRVAGVTETAVGYTGGTAENPTYEQVCTDRTGHAEAVRVTFDPAKVSYEQLLEVFWNCHDPTQHDRQGPDVGSQYRSAIFFHTPRQERTARASKTAQERSGRHRRPLATEILPAPPFWRAEDYHQQYLEKRGRATCHPGLQ